MTSLSFRLFGLRLLTLVGVVCISPLAHSTEPAYLADEGVNFGLSLGYGQLDNPVYNKDDIPLYVLPRVEVFAGDLSLTNTQLAWTPVWGNNYQLSLFSQLNEDGLYFANNSTALAAIRTTSGRPSMGTRPPSEQVTNLAVRRGNIAAITKRKLSIMSGAEGIYDWQNWRLSANWSMELTNYHKGLQGALAAQRLFSIQQHLFLLSAEVQHLSSGLVNYYYGSGGDDMRAGFSPYATHSSQKYNLKFSYQYHFNKKWHFISDLKYQHLSSGIADSPLIDDSNLLSFYLGFAWNYK